MHEYLAYLDGRSPAGMQEGIEKLEALGVDIPDLMLKRYKFSRRWADRASCVLRIGECKLDYPSIDLELPFRVFNGGSICQDFL